MDFPEGSHGKESACSAGDPGSIPGLGGSHREEHGNPLQYSCPENPMERGTWQATVCGVAKSWTGLSPPKPKGHSSTMVANPSTSIAWS